MRLLTRFDSLLNMEKRCTKINTLEKIQMRAIDDFRVAGIATCLYETEQNTVVYRSGN